MVKSPKVGIVGNPPVNMRGDVVDPVKGDRLTEYDVLLISPIFGGSTRPPKQSLELSTVEAFRAMFSRRRDELREFLAAGGAAVVFLTVPGNVRGGTEFNVQVAYDYELFLEQHALNRLGLANDSGTCIVPLDDDDPMTPYIRDVERWECTLQRGAYVDDPYAYPLAVNRQDKPIAYVEHVGRGVVYWLPPPTTAQHWHLARDGIKTAWTSTVDPLLGLAADELKRLDDDIAQTQSAARKAVSDLRAQREQVLARRQRLADEDPDVNRALQHYRAARHSSPAKALDFLHRMTETIEHVYGGSEAKAIAALRYSKATLNDITRPANHKPYRARHEGGEGKTVPKTELEAAFRAADDILGRFLRERQEHGYEQPAPSGPRSE